jgi:hypothetical protein
VTNEKKSALPTWLSFSLAELRCMLNIVLPTPALSREFRLRCFWQRRKQRLQAIAVRYHLPLELLLRLSLPP